MWPLIKGGARKEWLPLRITNSFRKKMIRAALLAAVVLLQTVNGK